nr:MAG TPA: hypothetical protein [Caudoviricetes sp.]
MLHIRFALTASLLHLPLRAVTHSAGRSLVERRGRRHIRTKRQHLRTIGDSHIATPTVASTVTRP